MNALIVFSALVAAGSASVIPAGLPLAHHHHAGFYGAYGLNYAPYATPVAAPLAAPVAVAAPLPAAPIAPVSSQYQAQDELGNINYGYSNINSHKTEVGNTYGGVTGSYSYVDAYGIPQRVDYIADALGFRVRASNLPVAPAVPDYPALEAPVFTGEAPVFTGVAPSPVQDTPEVAAAKAEFQAAFDEAASRAKRDVAVVAPAATLPYAAALPYAAPFNYGHNHLGYNHLGYNHFGYNHFGYNHFGYNNQFGYAAPAAYAAAAPAAIAPLAVAPAAYAAPAVAPAAREAVITRVKLNPGHAVAYRVD